MARLDLLSQREAKDLMIFYFTQAVPFSFGVLSDGEPAFMLKNSDDLVSNEDGSVTWEVSEVGVGLHSFIKLTTGETRKKQIIIPLCLMNPQSRQYLRLLLETTRNSSDARYNGKEAEFSVLTMDGRGVRIKVKLASLAINYDMLQIMPSQFALRYSSKHCPFCRQLQGAGKE